MLSRDPRSMSKRGSKPRVADATGSNRRPRTRGDMSGQQESSEEPDLRARLGEAELRVTELISEKEQSDAEAERVREQLQEAVEESRFHRGEAEALQAQYERLAMQSELDRLRALDQLRQEHQRELSEERVRNDLEGKRYDSWIASLEEKFQLEKLRLEERVFALGEELQALKQSDDDGGERNCGEEDSVGGSPSASEREAEVSEGVANETGSGRVITGDEAEPSDRRKVLCEEGGASVETSGESDSGKAAVEGSAASSAGGQVVSKQPGKSVAPVCTSGSGSNGGDNPVFALVDKVLEGGESYVD